MTEADVCSTLSEIFSDVFMRSDLVLQSDLTAEDVPGWDSFKHIEIIIAVEARFGIKFSTKELDSFRTVGDLARTVLVKLPN
jgi:acyl carrier protein